jgi:hypothetical protein
MRQRPELVRQPPDSPKSKYAAKVIYCNKVVIGRLTNGNIKERRSPVFLKTGPLAYRCMRQRLLLNHSAGCNAITGARVEQK